MNPPNHTRFVIACITLLAMTSAICGAWLLWKGFTGGGELVMTVNSAVAGMIGFLSNRPQPPPPPSVKDPSEVKIETTETK